MGRLLTGMAAAVSGAAATEADLEAEAEVDLVASADTAATKKKKGQVVAIMAIMATMNLVGGVASQQLQ